MKIPNICREDELRTNISQDKKDLREKERKDKAKQGQSKSGFREYFTDCQGKTQLITDRKDGFLSLPNRQ